MILNDLSLKEDKVIIKLNENNRKAFLRLAKKEGFKWSLSQEIKDNDECTFHVVLDLKLKIISNLSTMSYVKSKELQELKVITFKTDEKSF